ncbi:MAG: histidinol-phosphate aminotransferase family protein, partial [Oscillospiraceae bacterium]|nr:histidinol-phosphate aminotransferase family protein [Oscillospiraceae bacterium]
MKGYKMLKLPEKLNSFTPYEPLTGDYKVRFDVNESFIQLPHEKISRAIEKCQINRYPDPYATEAVEAFSRLFGTEPRYVTAGNGSDELIGLIAAGLLQKGNEVLTFEPDFSMYDFYLRLYELKVHKVFKNNDFEINIDELIEYINLNKIKCVVFSNPCNPTSLGISKSETARLVHRVAETGTLVVLDEAYMDFWNESESLLNDVHEYENLIVLRTCSKSVALAGIRMGFAVASERITRILRMIKWPFNVNSL